MDIKARIQEIFADSVQVKQATLADNLNAIVTSVEVITEALRAGGKVLIFGNGGSAADSQHIAAEFIGRFQKERRALAAISLTTDTSALTALGNDYGFDIVFSRQLEGLARRGDVAIGISTSGNSRNVIKAFESARALGVKTIALTGNNGGQMARMSDITIIVPSKITARIQESHICVAHAICELVENNFVDA